jgi:hypothetical protein
VYHVVPSAQRRRDQYECGKRRKCEVFGQYPPRAATRKMPHGKTPHAYATHGLRLQLAWLADTDDVNCMPVVNCGASLTPDPWILRVLTMDYHADVAARDALILGPIANPGGNFYRCSHGSLADGGLLAGIAPTVLRSKRANHPQKVRARDRNLPLRELALFLRLGHHAR